MAEAPESDQQSTNTASEAPAGSTEAPVGDDPFEQALHELAGIGDFLALAKDWLLENVFVWETALQFAVVSIAFVAAWFLARPISRMVAGITPGRDRPSVRVRHVLDR